MRLRWLLFFILSVSVSLAQQKKTELSIHYGNYTSVNDVQLNDEIHQRIDVPVDADKSWFLHPAPVNAYEIYVLKQRVRNSFRSRLSYGLTGSVSFQQHSFLLTNSEQVEEEFTQGNRMVYVLSFENTSYTIVNHRCNFGPSVLYRRYLTNRISLHTNLNVTASIPISYGIQHNRYSGRLKRIQEGGEVVSQEYVQIDGLTQQWNGLNSQIMAQTTLQVGGEFQLAEARPYYLKLAYTVGELISMDQLSVNTYQGFNVGILSIF